MFKLQFIGGMGQNQEHGIRDAIPGLSSQMIGWLDCHSQRLKQMLAATTIATRCQNP
jgi:hypothetical protein